MTNPIMPPGPHDRQRTDGARIGPGAQVRWNRIGSPPGWLLVTPTRAGACCATAWCCSRTAASYFQMAGSSPPAAARPGAAV